MAESKQKSKSTQSPQFDDVLKRMLKTPPKPHKDDKAKPEDNKPPK